jgi:arsenate reductase
MTDRLYNVLFLCVGNSARRIMAEAILNDLGCDHFHACALNHFALDPLQRLNLPTADLRSKPWSEFAKPGALEMDFVFTVCDKAAAEASPV